MNAGMADERRRTTLGPATSAAIPILWALLAEHGTQAKLAAHLGEDSGNVSRLLYGVRKAGRALSLKLRDFGVPVDSWEEALPGGWTLPPVPHDSVRDLGADESGSHAAPVAADIARAAGG